MLNLLKIKEPKLLTFHNQIVECFVENQISFSAEYQFEPDPKLNSVVHYLIQTNVERAGFICANKGKFGGVILQIEQTKYLLKEGFDLDDVFDTESVFSSAPCVMAFVCMLAVDRMKDLVFSKELEQEFYQIMLDKVDNK